MASFMDEEVSGFGGEVDLRSDTVTKPTAAMREAIAAAEVGDDVFGDDPTVQALEARVAKYFGKEAAMFVPSGTQGNLISILAHCWERGSEYIVGDRAHSYQWEQGGPSQFGGVHARAVRNLDDGTLDMAQVAASVRADNVHFPRTALLCVEDTHNMCGGRVLPLDFIDKAGQFAHEHGFPLHLDGARVWHSVIASGISAERRLQHVDSISVCLSKGMGCPVGSVVAGGATFMQRCRRLRKGLGGGLRQVGILAAAGLHAMDFHLERLAEDHANAKRLAEGFGALPHLSVDLATTQTNIVMVEIAASSPLQAPALVKALATENIRAINLPDGRMRLVTHLGVEAKDVEAAIAVARRILTAA